MPACRSAPPLGVAGTTGCAVYGAEVDLQPHFGGDLRVGIEPAPGWLVGAKLGLRSFIPDTIDRLGAQLEAEDLPTLHPGVVGRWCPAGRGPGLRL